MDRSKFAGLGEPPPGIELELAQAEPARLRYRPRVIWPVLALAAVALAILVQRLMSDRGPNGLDLLRESIDRHRTLTRAIAGERVRRKAAVDADSGPLSAHIARMEREREQMGEAIQKLQAQLARRGFGVGGYWLPTVEEFEREAEQASGKTGAKP